MIRNALISVSDKTNLNKLVPFLISRGTNIYASSLTHKHISELLTSTKTSISNLHLVQDLTQHVEFLEGRVKTLHPKIHGGILADRTNPQHMYELKTMEIPLIDMVVCNLYPFEKTISGLHTEKDAIENIDIGGPTMIRAAAKNFESVYVLTSPIEYEYFIKKMESFDDEDELLNLRKQLATSAFNNVTRYDAVISEYFNNIIRGEKDKLLIKNYRKEGDLRYGLNPQQKSASIYTSVSHSTSPFTVLSGAPGYINMLDAIYSWNLVKECSSALDLITVASFKHCSPAGVGTNLVPLSKEEKSAFLLTSRDLETPLSNTATAFLRARYTDPKCSFGDFLAFSSPVDMQTANLIKREVSDGIVAPGYDEGVVELLASKKGGKYLILQADPTFVPPSKEIRELHGVTLVQDRNETILRPIYFTPETAKTMTKIISDENKVNLALGMMTLKYTQSNSVAITFRGQTVGVGTGQQSQIDCVELAGEKAQLWYERQHPSVLKIKHAQKTKRVDRINNIYNYIKVNRDMLSYLIPEYCLASDAFFPFRDNIDVANKYYVRHVVQPGGSLADHSVTKACDGYGMSMFTTNGDRFFLH